MAAGETWDAIVIGSGIGGLSAAAGYAQAGHRVLVLEKLPNFGGAATIYRHGSLTMEGSLHEIDGASVNSQTGAFARLGLTGAVKPVGLNEFYEVRGGPLKEPILIPHGFDAAETAMCAAMPEAKKALQAYFRDLRQLYRALNGLEAISSHGLASLSGFLLSGGILELLSDMRQTVAQRLKHAFGDNEAAKTALGAMIGYFDDDPAALSFLLYGGIWGRYLETGGYYFDGGSRALTMALMKHVKQAGGEGLRNSTVTEVLVDDAGKAMGVRYLTSQGVDLTANAPVVFANIAPQLAANMLPQEHRASFAARYENNEPSVSLFTVSLGLSRPAAEFGVNAYSTFIFPPDMSAFEQLPEMAARFAGEPGRAMPYVSIADYGRLDAHIRQPDDPYLVAITGIDRLEWWNELDEAAEQARRQAWVDALIAYANTVFPGISNAVTQSEIATARTMKTRLGTPNGEVYGFRPTPQRLFGRPPSAATAIDGLYLSSAYTVSGGYAGAMQGGLLASDEALRKTR